MEIHPCVVAVAVSLPSLGLRGLKARRTRRRLHRNCCYRTSWCRRGRVWCWLPSRLRRLGGIAPNVTACRLRSLSNKPEVCDDIGAATACRAWDNVPVGVLQEVVIASSVQNVATYQSDDLLAVAKVVGADRTSAVVAVELNSCLSWSLGRGMLPTMLFFTFMSLTFGVYPLPRLLLVNGI